MLSGYCDPSVVRNAEEKHILVYLVKPISQAHLEAALARFQPFDWEHLPPYQVQCGVYTWQWLPPGAARPVPQTVQSVADLTRLGDWLPNADYMIGMGTPTEVPEPVLPLWCRFLAWRYAERTRSNGEPFFSLETMPYLQEMYEIAARPG